MNLALFLNMQPASATLALEPWTTFVTGRRASASARPTTAGGNATSAATATGTTQTAKVNELPKKIFSLIFLQSNWLFQLVTATPKELCQRFATRTPRSASARRVSTGPPDVTVARRATLIFPTVHHASARRSAQGMNLQFQYHFYIADKSLQSSSEICDLEDGQCPCYNNYGSRKCDECYLGYFQYPDCKGLFTNYCKLYKYYLIFMTF